MTKYLTLKYAWRLLWMSFAAQAFYIGFLDGQGTILSQALSAVNVIALMATVGALIGRSIEWLGRKLGKTW